MTVGWQSQKRKADASTKLVETDGVEHDKIMHSPEEMDENIWRTRRKNGLKNFFKGRN